MKSLTVTNNSRWELLSQTMSRGATMANVSMIKGKVRVFFVRSMDRPSVRVGKIRKYQLTDMSEQSVEQFRLRSSIGSSGHYGSERCVLNEVGYLSILTLYILVCIPLMSRNIPDVPARFQNDVREGS
jgi:hypothetical protein